jgi:hypothetical protein
MVSRNLTNSPRRAAVSEAIDAIFKQTLTKLDSPKKNQDEYNREDQAKGPARVISPTATVWPTRQCANQEDDQDD